MKRVGILGGTFDPVHNAHLELAHQAQIQFGLDKVLFIPTGRPVRKLGSTEASARDRFNMLQRACEEVDGFEVSSLEIERPQTTYTIDTLRELEDRRGSDTEFFFIVGEDTLHDLSTWKDASEIARMVTILYARRPGNHDKLDNGSEVNTLPEGFTCHEIAMNVEDLSSSCIRKALHEGRDVSAVLPEATLCYIKEQGLYGSNE